MNQGQEHRKIEALKGAGISWSKSKADVWDELSVRMEEGEGQDRIRPLIPGRQWLALAASLLLLLSVGAFMRVYTKSYVAPAGEHLSLSLPDGSVVILNADSQLGHHPYWWFVNRKVKLEGEAFFQVEKGRRFSVHSEQGLTTVLGTSFNIYARNADYRVRCHSGKVSVSNPGGNNELILLPGYQAELTPDGSFLQSAVDDGRTVPAWTRRLVLFMATPLDLVLQEVERQYGIEIEALGFEGLLYSGNFSLDEPVENVLTLICRPFGLEYEHHAGNKYRILPSGPD